jgi:ketosteroid isomerase-like protein
MDTQQQIEALEARFIEAMKTSNVDELQELLSDDLIFTNQNGHLVNKADDLNMHRSGKLEIYSLETSAQIITVFDDVAVVSVVQDLGGAFDGHTYAGIFRYTRVWKLTDSKWQVITGHVSQLVS